MVVDFDLVSKDVTFSADHRVVEGIELARFVQTWKEVVENPERMIVG